MRCVVMVICLHIGLCCAAGNADERERLIEAARNSMTELKVNLKSDDGRPVVGAHVMPYAMRTVEKRGHGFWVQEVFGRPKNYLSDEEGCASILYPGKAFGMPKLFTTSLVTFIIKHSGKR